MEGIHIDLLGARRVEDGAGNSGRRGPWVDLLPMTCLSFWMSVSSLMGCPRDALGSGMREAGQVGPSHFPFLTQSSWKDWTCPRGAQVAEARGVSEEWVHR